MNEQEQAIGQALAALAEANGMDINELMSNIAKLKQQEDEDPTKKGLVAKYLQGLISSASESAIFRKGGKMEAAVNKFQRGGRMSRREFRDTMMSGMGYDKSNFRDAYRNAKIQYGYDRSAAREMMLNSIPKEENKGITYSPTPPVEGHGAPGGQVSVSSYVNATNKPSASEWGASMQSSELDATLSPGPVDSGKIEIKPKISPATNPHLAANGYNWDSLSFNEAFRRGRERALSGGQSTFTWRGNEYGIDLKGPKKEEQTAREKELERISKKDVNVAMNSASQTEHQAGYSANRPAVSVSIYETEEGTPASSAEQEWLARQKEAANIKADAEYNQHYGFSSKFPKSAKPSFWSRVSSVMANNASLMKEKGGKINKCQSGRSITSYRPLTDREVYEGGNLHSRGEELYRQDPSGYYYRDVIGQDTIFQFRPNLGETYDIIARPGYRGGEYNNIKGESIKLSPSKIDSIIRIITPKVENQKNNKK